jgi:hypothetical protein
MERDILAAHACSLGHLQFVTGLEAGMRIALDAMRRARIEPRSLKLLEKIHADSMARASSMRANHFDRFETEAAIDRLKIEWLEAHASKTSHRRDAESAEIAAEVDP